jgi:hypothetical protein
MSDNKNIKFNDLSTPLKIAIIGAWISLVIWVLSFLVGFIIGIMGGN